MVFNFLKFKKDSDKKPDAQSHKLLNNWYKDSYQGVLIQRNILFILFVGALVIIMTSLLTIRYLRGVQNIEPFVIEIEKKTGVPTVVDPVSVKAYSSNMAIKRYFVMKYINAREEYFSETFNYNYSTVVRVLSSSSVYYSDYRPKFNKSNPNSPYNLYGSVLYRTVGLKSIIFPTENSAQIRISLNVSGSLGDKMNKIIFMEFNFVNIEMSDEERLINPLGFRVTLYRIDDEKV